MKVVRGSHLGHNSVRYEHEMVRNANANKTSGELGSAFGGTLV